MRLGPVTGRVDVGPAREDKAVEPPDEGVEGTVATLSGRAG